MRVNLNRDDFAAAPFFSAAGATRSKDELGLRTQGTL